MAIKKVDKFLNNNESLPVSITVDYTAEQTLEMEKCMNDIEYFAQKYFVIVNLDHGRQPIKLFDAQKRAIHSIIDNKRTIICASRQIGKPLAIDTPIPTPTGWKLMGDLVDGDEVLDWNGNPTLVTKAHDISNDINCFELTFSNEETIVAGEHHEWFTESIYETKGSIKTTVEIYNDIKNINFNYIHRIPIKYKTNESSNEDEYVYIVDVKKVEKVPVRCISVDNPDHMFLAGRKLIPTHNSTLMTIVCLWYVIFNKDYQVAVLANKEDQAKEILERIKLAYEELPNWLKSGVQEFTKEVLKLVNGSKIFVSTTSESGIRGKSVNMLFVDEFAHIAPQIAEPFFKSVMPTISSSKKAKIVLISCVTRDTFLLSSNGLCQMNDFIEDSKQHDYEIPEYKILGKNKLRSGTTMFNSGKSPIYEITTQSSHLKASPNHKLFACKDGNYGWHKMEELTDNDYIAIQHGNEIWGNDDSLEFSPSISNKIKNKFAPEKITPELAYLIGLYIAEGSCYKKYVNGNFIGGIITLTCGDDLHSAISSVGLKYTKTKNDDLHYFISSKNFIEFLEYVGFDLSKKAPKKTIPSRLLKMSRENMTQLMRGIFDGDGSAVRDGRVNINSSSSELIDQIRYILLNFGILCEYGTGVTPPTKKVKVESTYYRLTLNGVNAQIFYQKIGFNFDRKQKILESHYKDSELIINDMDTVPFVAELFKNDFEKVKKKNLNKELVNRFYEKESISRYSLLKFKNKYSFSNDLLNEIVDENIRWEKIKSNKIIGEDYVYDFSLPNSEEHDPFDWNHSVIYNGIIGHQTPKGADGKFFEIFREAEKSKEKNIKGGWTPVKIHYSEVPGRDDAWKKEELASINYDMDTWKQEYEIEFLESGTAAINQGVIERLKGMCRPAEFSFDDGTYYVWKEPEPNRIISIGVDVAEGVGQDFTIAIVMDITDLDSIEMCAIFASNKMQPWIFAEKLNQIARAWGRPFLAIERNKEGGQVIDAIMNVHNYDNLVHYSMKNDKRGVYQSPGIFCHQNSKYVGIQNMKYFVETKQAVNIYDINVVREFETFIRKINKTWGAKKGHHDDRVMALVWALVILEKDLAEKYLDVIEYDEAGKPSAIIDPNQNLANGEFKNLNSDNKPIREMNNKEYNVFFNPYTPSTPSIPEKYQAMLEESTWEFV